jgi:CRISPR/Cas system CSM-associated protein Csm3 (group 7 of RAMP superfamily)
VASGLLERTGDRRYPMVKAHFRTGQKLAIPATSLKGCIRSILEAISPSAPAVTRARPLPPGMEPSRSVERLDPAQRIFGALGYQGQVRFADAMLEAGEAEIVESLQLFRTHPESTATYFDGGRVRGRKFYMHGALAKGSLPLEACPVGSRFALRADFENLTAGELGLLLIALGLGEPRLWPKLGGGKPACLGTIEVTEARATGYDAARAYEDFDAGAEPLEIGPRLAAARQERLALDEQLRRVAEVLRWPREDRACPDEAY